MKVDGWGYIEHMIRDCEDIVEVLEEVIDYDTFVARRVLHKSIIYSLLNLGEKMKKISEEDRLQAPNIPWKSVIQLRNIAAHGYDNLDLRIVWKIASNVPAILLYLQQQQSAKTSELYPKEPGEYIGQLADKDRFIWTENGWDYNKK
ncbi:MAG: DUF86 domain-containing protein [Defluviitaleaceae bacterium]|nr:DUF86 domain-containing protein [Defluviitaleaceae bacterium]